MSRIRYLAALLSMTCLSCSVYAADWPQFLGPTRNGVSTETGLLTSWPKDGPPRLWQQEVGEGYSGPVVVGERLVLFHRLGENDVVDCLHAGTGQSKWRFTYPTRYSDELGKGDGPRSTPLVAGGRVFTLGAAGALHCLDLASGQKIWSRQLSEDYSAPKGFFGVATSPILEGDLVLVNVGARNAGIVAFHKDTGKEVWKADEHEASYSSPVAATLDGQRMVFFLTREGLVVLDPASGKILQSRRWRSRMHASVNAAVPVLLGNQLFLSASYGTGAVLLQVGKGRCDEVWKSDAVLSNHYNTSLHKDGFLYGIDGRQEQRPRLRCIEAKTGQVRWTEEEFGCASMILADGKLIALREDGNLLLIEATPNGYRELARAAVLGSACRAEIALAEGLLYGRDGQKLTCWKVKK